MMQQIREHWMELARTAAWLIAMAGWLETLWLIVRLRKNLDRERAAWWGMDRAREWQLTTLGARVTVLEHLIMGSPARTDPPPPAEIPDQPTLRELSLLRPPIPPPAQMR